MDEAVDAVVEAWLQDDVALLVEIVALQGDGPGTPYRAALAAAMAAVHE